MTIACGCWRCTGRAWNDGTVHTGSWAYGPVDGFIYPYNPDPLRAPGTDTDPGPPWSPDDDGHPEAVIAWIAISALAWLVVGVIVWMVVRRV